MTGKNSHKRKGTEYFMTVVPENEEEEDAKRKRLEYDVDKSVRLIK